MSDTITLCATRRLARHYRSSLPQGDVPVWQTPRAHTVDDWLAHLAEEARLVGHMPANLLLAPLAEGILWEQVIESSMDDSVTPLFDIAGMAATAMDADKLLLEWRIPAGGNGASFEMVAYAQWRKEFEAKLNEMKCTTALRLQVRVIDVLRQGFLELPPNVLFAGFEHHTRLIDDLRDALVLRGVSVEDLPFAGEIEADSSLTALADLAAECHAAALWAKRQLDAVPEKRLAIIAPDLQKVRDLLEFELDDALHPEMRNPHFAEHPRKFNFSLGRRLTDIPIAAAALDLIYLALRPKRIRQHDISKLLLSPYWSSWEERDERARLDAAIRKDIGFYTDLEEVAAYVASPKKGNAPQLPILVQHLMRFSAAIKAYEGHKCLPSEWTRLFRAWLKTVGWVGDGEPTGRPLSSHEYQTVGAWLETLAEFTQLDEVCGKIAIEDAYRRLRLCCQRKVFQAETVGTPSVQVLGMLEAKGFQFDAIWVLDMTDEVWPPAPSPNPLLSSTLQRKMRIPGSSAEVQLEYARLTLSRLAQSAPEIIYSYAQADGDKHQRPSPLIASVKPSSMTEESEIGECVSGHDLEYIDDSIAPSLFPGHKIRGGTWAIRAQAICPAWAFYEYRLGAKALEKSAEGLEAKDRGTLIHSMLEEFWKNVRTSARLKAMNDSELQTEIEKAVQAGIENHIKSTRTTLPHRFRALETEYLNELMHTWINIEKSRNEEFEVIAFEKRETYDFDGIPVSMTIDRIDRLEDGRHVIIDYKTGSTIDTKNWASDRLTEPQLPIYAALVSGPVDTTPVCAVVFAKVLIEKSGFNGIASKGGLLKGVDGLEKSRELYGPEKFPTWPSLLEHWKVRLTAVAKELTGGQAGVFFTDEKSLEYCAVKPLLRLAERKEQFNLKIALDAADAAKESA